MATLQTRSQVEFVGTNDVAEKCSNNWTWRSTNLWRFENSKTKIFTIVYPAADNCMNLISKCTKKYLIQKIEFIQKFLSTPLNLRDHKDQVHVCIITC